MESCEGIGGAEGLLVPSCPVFCGHADARIFAELGAESFLFGCTHTATSE